MIVGLIVGLSVLFLVLISLFIYKVFKSNMQFRGEVLASLFFVASIIISLNLFSFAIYIDDSGSVIETFSIDETYTELIIADNNYKKLVIAYNDNGVTLNKNYDRIFGDYHKSTTIEIRQDALGTKAVFV